MAISINRYGIIVLVLFALFTSNNALAHPGPAHIHDGPQMVLHHDSHSPFEHNDHAVNADGDNRSLHCVLKGHDPNQPCPDMKSRKTERDGVVRIGMECGGAAGPDGKSVVKTGGSFYGVVSAPSETTCTSQKLFPSLHPMISRSPQGIAPPPRRALHSN